MFSVGVAQPNDIEDIAELLDGVDRYYGATELEPREDRKSQITEALFSEVPAGYALIARDGSRAVGFASYSFLWPAAGTSRSLFLKELYVVESHRGQGVGALIMQSVFDVASKYGCSRVEWHADSDNPIAIRFYEKLGFQSDPSKHFYRASGEHLARRIV